MEINRIVSLHFLIVFIIIWRVSCDVKPPIINPGILTPAKTIGECHSCKIFIESFRNGLERTARGKYEGGDAAWEEEKLKKSYKRSEMRLIDIQDGLCKEESKYAVQCHHTAEKAEEFIEEWWAQNPDESDDLFTYICIDKMKLCCPKHHYGKSCTPCPGDHSNLCNGHGRCRGEGTRKGNGTCLCDPGYKGPNCDECAPGYYQSKRDDKDVCLKCHISCMGGCRDGTARDCIACKHGFEFDIDEGCMDVDECNDEKVCKPNQFCANSVGSYKCINCHKFCNGCYGDGPDMCKKCADGHTKKGQFCLSDSNMDDEAERLTKTRYITYVGLLVATGILLPKSTHIGSMVGIMVLSYIVGAEYYCMINGHMGLINLKDLDLFQLFVL
ncbi:cysteine-rich with EGF-like domain protein 2 [Aricia agestis]|uniref:cysteine-rich with EGF-like domain protein 2 n=1 Tax=Aricia agestis TaxID=91739 RepID=UPI001C202D36|nr:cysteine-rich with EGF-like domain protein 2 [Aricia agestis]XP_041974661.1 cysteine-rich with EGF-like domain protein 2 [Aricia agestis]